MNAMYALEILLLLAGAVMLVAGYRKTRRNMMLAGAIALWLSGALPQLMGGMMDGMSGADRATAAIAR